MLKLVAFSLTLFALNATLFATDYSPNSIPYPTGFPVIEREGYTVGYDSRNRIPLWTQEHLTKDNVSGKISRRFRFKTDPDIYELHVSTNEDYTGSGFDRGHMVPDADRDNTLDILKETYLYSNACPQNHPFNDGVWGDLEDHARDLVMELGYDSADVISGPLFMPFEREDGKWYVQYQVIGKNRVAVPTHFFKIIHANRGEETDTWAYIIPTTEGYESENLDDFLTTISAVEFASGLKFNHFE